jgi:hypothetical protein
MMAAPGIGRIYMLIAIAASGPENFNGVVVLQEK